MNQLNFLPEYQKYIGLGAWDKYRFPLRGRLLAQVLVAVHAAGEPSNRNLSAKDQAKGKSGIVLRDSFQTRLVLQVQGHSPDKGRVLEVLLGSESPCW